MNGSEISGVDTVTDIPSPSNFFYGTVLKERKKDKVVISSAVMSSSDRCPRGVMRRGKGSHTD